jgi:hypothetical protein
MYRFTILGRCLASNLGQTPVKTVTPVTGTVQHQQVRGNAGGPEKIECFVDGKKVLVDPGTTVLQVRLPFSAVSLAFFQLSCYSNYQF